MPVSGPRCERWSRYGAAMAPQLRYQDVPLYNSVFRFDDEMFVTPHLYGTQGTPRRA
jgi:hypothetical protein